MLRGLMTCMPTPLGALSTGERRQYSECMCVFWLALKYIGIGACAVADHGGWIE